MADYVVVPKSSIDATADAIRQKTGSQSDIEWTQDGFADAIEAIEIGGNVSKKNIIANVTVSEDTHGIVVKFSESAKWREIEIIVELTMSEQNTGNGTLWVAKTTSESDSGGITSGACVGSFGGFPYNYNSIGYIHYLFTEDAGYQTRANIARGNTINVGTAYVWKYANLAGGELDRLKLGTQNGATYIPAGSKIIVFGVKQ